jgi:hypothetical protein
LLLCAVKGRLCTQHVNLGVEAACPVQLCR